jgi:spermidine synthase
MNPGGVMAQQCGTPVYHPEELRNTYLALSKVFRYVRVFLAYIPTYPSGMWAFVMASDSELRRRRDASFETRYYSDALYESSMVLPKFVEECCKYDKKQD